MSTGHVHMLTAHPTWATYRQLTDSEQEAATVPLDMIRLSIGIGHIDDIGQALEASAA